MLENLGRTMSAAEMKQIKGGKLEMNHCTWSGMCSSFPSINYDDAGADMAQGYADSWCESQNCCGDVDCPGAA